MANKIATYDYVNQLIGASSLTGNRCVTKSVLLSNWNADETQLTDYLDNQLIKEEHIKSGMSYPDEELIYYVIYTNSNPSPLIDKYNIGMVTGTNPSYNNRGLVCGSTQDFSLGVPNFPNKNYNEFLDEEYMAVEYTIDHNDFYWYSGSSYNIELLTGVVIVMTSNIGVLAGAIYFANLNGVPYIVLYSNRTSGQDYAGFYLKKQISTSITYNKGIVKYLWDWRKGKITFRISGATNINYSFNLVDELSSLGIETNNIRFNIPKYGLLSTDMTDGSPSGLAITALYPTYIQDAKMWTNIGKVDFSCCIDSLNSDSGNAPIYGAGSSYAPTWSSSAKNAIFTDDTCYWTLNLPSSYNKIILEYEVYITPFRGHNMLSNDGDGDAGGTNNSWMCVYLDGNYSKQLRWAYGSGWPIDSFIGTINQNTWYSIKIEFDYTTNQGKFYLDNVLKLTQAKTATRPTKLRFGNGTYNDKMDGYLRNVKITTY